MTHACCPECGLRFARTRLAEVTECPDCRRPVAHLESSRVMGWRLVAPPPFAPGLEKAIAATLDHPTVEPDPA